VGKADIGGASALPQTFDMLRFHASQPCGLLLAALLAGCGTTVPLAQQGGTSSTLDGSLGAGTTGGSSVAGTSTTGAGTGSIAGGTGGGTGIGTGGASGTGTGQVSTVTPGTGASAPAVGVTDAAPLKVGVFYLNGGNQLISSAFPGSSVSFGDGKREAQAIIDDVNAHGGAGGHKLVPGWIPIEATDNDANRQQKCLGAVQDLKPVAVFAIFNLTAGLARCVQQSNVLMIDVALGAGDEVLYSQAKNLAFSPSQLTRDAEQKLVLGLARKEGKLPPGKTVGLVAQGDDPMYPRVLRNTVEPLLKSWGVPYSEQILSSGSDTSGMNGAILKFQSSRVDTVVFSLGSGGIPEVLFMQAAEQQQFRPAYLMGDSTDTNFVGSQAPANQIKRISGAGTYPLANVRADQYPSSPAERKCLATLNKAIGGYTNRYSSLTGTLYCEIIGSFAFVAGRVQGPVTSAAWSQAYHALGSAYTPVTSFTTKFLPGRPDGASSYRSIGYGTSCSCLTYTSPTRPIPAS
jgi:ABC-type branched-subunit amino acid transport system substrate-binding protein